MFRRAKITVVGAGATGATTAHLLVLKNLGDVVLIDIVDGVAEGRALDILESTPIEGVSSHVRGTTDYDATANSDVIVITAGIPRKPGMSRNDLLKINADIVSQVARETALRSPDAVIVVLSNPADVMAYVAQKASGFPHYRVMGQAGVLDSSRFRTFLAEALNVSPEDVSAFVMGGHGDDMVPLVRYSYAGGIPVETLLPKDTLDDIVARTRTGGGEIINLMKSSAYYAPASSLAQMVKAVLHDERRILPIIAYLNGHYGEKDLYVGVPTIVGANGVERVLEIELTEDEKVAFKNSVASVRGPLNMLHYQD